MAFRLGIIQRNGVIGDFTSSILALVAGYDEAVRDGASLVVADIGAFTGYPLFSMGSHRAFLDAQHKALDQLAQALPVSSVPLIIRAVRTPAHGDEADFDSVVLTHGTWTWFPHPSLTVGDMAVYVSSEQLLHHHEVGAPALYVLADGDPFVMEGNPHRSLHFFQNNARRMRCAIAHVARVGGQDAYIYSGGSAIINAAGGLIGRLPFHRSSTMVVSLDAPTITDSKPSLGDMGFLYDHLVSAMADYVAKNGFKGIVLGLSGGIDSALTAAIAVDALGSSSVLGVLMPSVHTSDLSRRLALETCQLLGIRFLEMPIAPSVSLVDKALLASALQLSPAPLSAITVENTQARMRGLYLMGLSNQFGYLLVSTGNKSESAVGYATLYGDMCGGFNVLGDIYKTDIWALARHRNDRSLAIPPESITRPPTAELHAGQQDEDSLPPYPMLDAILRRFLEDLASPDQVIADGNAPLDVVYHVWRLLMQSQYKRQQACLSLVVSATSLSDFWQFPISHQLLRLKGLS